MFVGWCRLAEIVWTDGSLTSCDVLVFGFVPVFRRVACWVWGLFFCMGGEPGFWGLW